MARPRKPPKPLSEDRLRATAVEYLARFAASRAQVLQVLERKIKRDLARLEGGSDAAPWRQAARRIVDDLARQGFLDDHRFAAARARRLLENGKSLARTRADLEARGVAADVIAASLAQALGDASAETADLAAAVRFARRRRLGPFAVEPGDAAAHRKALAAFARAGFSYQVARRVLAAADAAALDAEA